MKLFIDANVALAAAGQQTGASRAIFDAAPTMSWELQASNYVLREIAANFTVFHRSRRRSGRPWRNGC